MAPRSTPPTSPGCASGSSQIRADETPPGCRDAETRACTGSPHWLDVQLLDQRWSQQVALARLEADADSQVAHRPTTPRRQARRPPWGHEPPDRGPTRALPGRLTTPPDGPDTGPLGAAGAGRRCWSAPAVLYLWGLGESGWANSFYSAAAQAGVGVVEGVLLRLLRRRQLDHRRQDAALAVADGAVGEDLRPVVAGACWSRRRSRAWRRSGCCTPRSAVRRGRRRPACSPVSVLATTPVAVLMFRFDNPDALLTLLLVGAAYATLRAVESDGVRHPVRWLALAGALVGLGVPHQDAAGLPGACRRSAWSTCSSRTPRSPKRLGHLLVGLGAMVAVGRLVGRDRLAVAGDQPPLHRRLARTTRSSS